MPMHLHLKPAVSLRPLNHNEPTIHEIILDVDRYHMGHHWLTGSMTLVMTDCNGVRSTLSMPFELKLDGFWNIGPRGLLARIKPRLQRSYYGLDVATLKIVN